MVWDITVFHLRFFYMVKDNILFPFMVWDIYLYPFFYMVADNIFFPFIISDVSVFAFFFLILVLFFN